jgi:hypothetical protein
LAVGGREVGGWGGKDRFLERYPPNIHSLAKQGFFRGEAAFLIQAFPWETEFMNIALWSPRGAQARERTRTAGTTTPQENSRLSAAEEQIISDRTANVKQLNSR